ncbi:hypothetical protein RCF19_34350 [Rhodococcus qingshengii]
MGSAAMADKLYVSVNTVKTQLRTLTRSHPSRFHTLRDHVDGAGSFAFTLSGRCPR